MSEQHTPGPCKWDDDGFTSLSAIGSEVITYAPYENSWLSFGPHREANARLIASAPDLLAALKAMVASYHGLRDMLTNGVVLDKLNAAEAAIAKAEGKQP